MKHFVSGFFERQEREHGSCYLHSSIFGLAGYVCRWLCLHRVFLPLAVFLPVFLRLCISLLLFLVEFGFFRLRRLLAGSHHGLRTRRGVLPPCPRDPTFHPRTSPLRSAPFLLHAGTRSRRNPLLGRGHRSRCHALLAGLALLHFVVAYIFQARRTCFPTAYSGWTSVSLPSSFLSSGTGCAMDQKYRLRRLVERHPPYRQRVEFRPPGESHDGVGKEPVQDGLRRSG